MRARGGWWVSGLALALAACSGGSTGGTDSGHSDGGASDGFDATTGSSDGSGGDDGSRSDGSNNGGDGSRSDGSNSGNDGAISDGSGGGDGGTQGDACGGMGFAVHARAPNVLITLDRSCSMRQPVVRVRGDAGVTDSGSVDSGADAGTNDPKWDIAVRTVTDLTNRRGTRVRFGLEVFPALNSRCNSSPDGYGLAEIMVQPATGTATMIQSTLALPHLSPFDDCATNTTADAGVVDGGDSGIFIAPSNTPISAALAEAAMTPAFADMTRGAVVMLITDGSESCVAAADRINVLTTRTQALRAVGVRTAVVGFGGNTDSPTQLDAIAQAGGLARTGAATSYYTAADQTELLSALDAITQQALSCTLDLDGTPPDPNNLTVTANGTALTRDSSHAEGWDYDAALNAVVFYGSACANLQDGTYTSVGVGFGCAQPACTPSTEICDGLDNDCNGAVDDNCFPG